MASIRIHRSDDGQRIWTGYDYGASGDAGSDYPATEEGFRALRDDLIGNEEMDLAAVEEIDALDMPEPGQSSGRVVLDRAEARP